MTPLPFTYEGEGEFRASAGFRRRADEQFVIGERYVLVEHHERSTATHNHEFAWVADAWASLPEHLAAQHPSAEHLRKWALIKAGFCTVQDFPCASRAEADRLRRVLGADDDYAIVIADNAVVRRYRAESQSRRHMDRERFQASKEGILRVIADLLEVEPEALLGAPQRAAA